MFSPPCLGEAAAMPPRGGFVCVSPAGSRSRTMLHEGFRVQVTTLSGDTFKYYYIDGDWTGEMLYVPWLMMTVHFAMLLCSIGQSLCNVGFVQR